MVIRESQSSSLVTVALPVHNGGRDFRRCIQNLQNQTLRDFRVYIFENASTDGTRGFSEMVSRTDNRFKLLPSDNLLPMMENFRRAIATSADQSKYFCLRAADDFTSNDFLERLCDALQREETAHLAVCKVQHVEPDGTLGIFEDCNLDQVLDRSNMQNWKTGCSGAWFYGVYRAGPATDYLLDCMQRFSSEWGFDRLVVYKMLSDFGVTFVDGPLFFAQKGSPSEAKYRPKTVREALKRRISYYRACMAMDAHRNVRGLAAKIRSRRMAWLVAGRHTETKLKHLRRILFS